MAQRSSDVLNSTCRFGGRYAPGFALERRSAIGSTVQTNEWLYLTASAVG